MHHGCFGSAAVYTCDRSVALIGLKVLARRLQAFTRPPFFLAVDALERPRCTRLIHGIASLERRSDMATHPPCVATGP